MEKKRSVRKASQGKTRPAKSGARVREQLAAWIGSAEPALLENLIAAAPLSEILGTPVPKESTVAVASAMFLAAREFFLEKGALAADLLVLVHIPLRGSSTLKTNPPKFEALTSGLTAEEPSLFLMLRRGLQFFDLAEEYHVAIPLPEPLSQEDVQGFYATGRNQEDMEDDAPFSRGIYLQWAFA